MSDPLHIGPVGAYGLFAAYVGGQFVAGGLSEAHALANARRVLEAGAGAHFLPVVEVQSFGRGIKIHRDRLPALEHRLPGVVACAETVRQRFVRVWMQHLAESSYAHAQEGRIAANLARILSETSATRWLEWRNRDDLKGPRCPLTDPWFEEPTVTPDCCGVETAAGDVDYVGRPGRGFSICRWCSEIERQEAERT